MNIDEIIWVIGIVDAYGAVHSKIINMNDKHGDMTHGELWPGNLKRWRWSMSEGLTWIVGSSVPSDFDIEEQDAIERHLEKLGMSEDQIHYGS